MSNDQIQNPEEEAAQVTAAPSTETTTKSSKKTATASDHEDFDWDAATMREQEMLRQMDVDGTLTAEQRAILDDIEAIDARTDTYIKAVQAAAVCVMRS